MEVRAMGGEMHLIRLPGSPTIALTRTEASELARCIYSQLKIAEPFVVRVSLWRRIRDRLRRFFDAETRRREAAMREKVRRLMGSEHV